VGSYGLVQVEYCAEHRIRLGSFVRWRSRLARVDPAAVGSPKRKAQPTLVPLTVLSGRVALNEAQETALYAEIEGELDHIKAGVVDTWLNPDVALAGGYGRNITSWRTQAVTIFKDHRQMVRALADSTAIRSNGHAWCTADDNLCVGNDIERTRCSDCNNAVIGPQHAPLYKGLYDHLKEVRDCDDIGEGGLNVVRRDMDRCRRVLVALEQEDHNGRAA
jgi:hypothetical protein